MTNLSTATADAIATLHGRVLEIGAGHGANFHHLNPGVHWLGLEPDHTRRATLTTRARHAGHPEPPLNAPAEHIPLPDATVDAVLATSVLCSVRDQHRVLAEIRRVLIPGGRAVLAEHVIAPPHTLTRLLQRAATPWSLAFDHGCHPARDTEAAVRASTLVIDTVQPAAIPVLGRLTLPHVVITAHRPAPDEPRPEEAT